ncbi:MAG: hypothetical protein IJS32_08490, partial [Kiritimatiellae bacterium]|nr:hypothetical protein [Kiritimatiellia bacterium]
RRGEPEPGAVFETEIFFPRAAAQAETAEITLFAGNRHCRCDDLASFATALPFPALLEIGLAKPSRD